MRSSKYWDDFERRINETVQAVSSETIPTIRRVACFITDKCNFNCSYCNYKKRNNTMSKETFVDMLEKYGNTSIIHITGGEPSTVPWLYDFIDKNANKYRFHLNTNAYIKPPYKSVKRLKISLDSCDKYYWNSLVGRNAFDTVVENIKQSIPHTIVSITYTLTKQNYKNTIEFAKFCKKEFTNMYAVFFSVYKGTDKRFVLSNEDADCFFVDILPELKSNLNEESKNLIKETIDEKIRLMKGIRFKQNCNKEQCYISMSERVISPNGNEYTCSHLYRDKVFMRRPNKHIKCTYGCNRRLVAFNEEVQNRINNLG